jgi:hypothetical protein
VPIDNVGVGLLTTSPHAPSDECFATKITLLEKYGSSLLGCDTKICPNKCFIPFIGIFNKINNTYEHC